MRNLWCEMFQAYAPASPNATRSPTRRARGRPIRTRRASTSLGVHSCPAIVTASSRTPGRGHEM
jgi:hypothetical protein